jgi:hypothetical protein
MHAEISDIGPTQVCLAWDAARRSPLIAEFVSIAAEHEATATASI